MKRKRVLLLTIFVMLHLLNLNNSPSSANFSSTTRIWTILDEPQPEIPANGTTQINMTLLEVFDNESIDTTQTERLLIFNCGLYSLYYWDWDLDRSIPINLTSGDTWVWSFTETPYFNSTTSLYSMPMAGYCSLSYGILFAGSLLGAAVFPLNLSIIEGLNRATADNIALDLDFGILFVEETVMNKTVDNILTIEYHYTKNDTQYTFTLDDDVFYEMNFTLSIDLLTGFVINYSVISHENYQLVYKLICSYSSPYINEGFDIIEIDYSTEIQEGVQPDISVTARDTAGAYFEISFRLKGDTNWIKYQIQTGSSIGDEMFQDMTETFATGKYLMDGEYEYNITVWSKQSIRYELIIAFIVIEDLPYLNENFSMFAILFVTIIILFRSKKKQDKQVIFLSKVYKSRLEAE